MNRIHQDDRSLSGQAALVAAVSGHGFGSAVLEYVSKFATVRNFCVFYFPDLACQRAFHSVWSGQIGDYWLRRHGVIIVNEPDLIKPILVSVRAAPTSGVSIERGRPLDGDPVKQLYDQFGVLERVTVASRGSQFGYQSFFLRDEADGWFTDEEFDKLCENLPMVHELVGLRHLIVGSENFQFTAGSSTSSLRERQVMRFSKLSRREAEVCDCIANGNTIAGTALKLGIALATVRALRQQAYRKLDVTSATQLMALILHDAKFDSIDRAGPESI